METQKPILLGFCLAGNITDGFKGFDKNGEPTWPELRAAGFAAAYRGNFVREIVLFGPEHEIELMKYELIVRGVPDHAIKGHFTNLSTYSNGVEMKRFIAESGLDREEFVMSSSCFHLRSIFFGNRNDVFVQFVPAEAYIFAITAPERVDELFRQISKRFGDSTMARQITSEIRGIGDELADRYVVPTIEVE